MANEVRAQISLQINSGSYEYRSSPTYFTADLTNVKGTLPGDLTVPITGIVVSLAGLTRPGLCWLQNVDLTNFVTLGIYDNAKFYPLAEILPGEMYLLRLSRYINQEFTGTGTGTNADINKLMFIADTASCVVRAHAFDS